MGEPLCRSLAIPNRVLLRAGQGKGKSGADALIEQLVDPQDRRGDAPLADSPADSQANLHQHQLVINNPPTGAHRLIQIRGPMDRKIRLAALHQSALSHQLR